jgi:hypothetical protein
MQMTFPKWTKVFIVLLASVYLFIGAASLAHFHKDSIGHNNCLLCNYYQNCQYQDVPCQTFVVELLLLQTFPLSEPVVSPIKVFFHNDTSRAPPQSQIV